MKLNLVALTVLSLSAAPAFAHGDHDDHGPVVKPGKEVRKDDAASKLPGEAAAAAEKDAKPAEAAPPAPKAP